MYFSKFPLTVYDVKGNGNYTLLPDILRRVKIRAGIASSRLVFDKYNVKEGEKPEDVAFKYYGDAEYHWVIMMINNITDRYYGWPMTQADFADFLTDKYGAGNQDGVHHYEITQASGRSTPNGPDDFSHKVEVNSDEDDAETITNRVYEERLQNNYIQIRFLDPKYLPTFLQEFDRLIKG